MTEGCVRVILVGNVQLVPFASPFSLETFQEPPFWKFHQEAT